MQFRTEIEPMPSRQPISYRDGIMVLGSCFADNIGAWLKGLCFDVCDNPFGVLYNPASIGSSLLTLLKPDTEKMLCEDNMFVGTDGYWYSYDFHGKFCAKTKDQLRLMLEDTITKARTALSAARHLIITFGTSWVYEHDGCVVANCHKMPASNFLRRRMSVGQIVEIWKALIESMGDKHILFTVSPIRHVKDTLHGNQVSKSALMLAVDHLCQTFPDNVEYVPAYEMLIDDLRDYRFYADDLVHPSPMAVGLVRQYFARNFFDKQTQEYVRDVEPLVKASQHRPIHPDSEAHQAFKCQINLKIDQLIEKYSNFGLSNLKV